MSSDHTPWFVFAGGGTGGHLYPALSVVDQLRGFDRPMDVTFFCTSRPIDGEVLGKMRVESHPLSVRPFSTRPWQWAGFLYHWRRSVTECMQAFRRRPPAVVVGAGGYASGPPVEAALRLRIPAFLLNPDAVPGRANRHFAARPRLTGIFAQWDITRTYFPPSAPVWVMGCPVREGFRPRSPAERADTLRSFDLESDRPTLLVTGASQGARTINEALMLLAEEIARTEWQVLHLSGKDDRQRVERCYAEAGLPARVLTFTDRMPEAMSASDLIVARAGASSLAEITSTGIPAILLPYPYHRDEHQRHNGQQLVDGGAALMMRDTKDAASNATALRPLLNKLMTQGELRGRMKESSLRMGRPKAARQIAGRLAESAGWDVARFVRLAG